ncbi:MAG TPA: flagellar motor switch protein FliN [Anaerolineae bacterium]|nr:flagellar motor switch protein FliN [Anaerolineae bacterium]
MEQNESAEEVKETKNDKEIGGDDVQEEMKASVKPVEEKPVEEKPVEEKPVEEKPVEEKPVKKKPVEKKEVSNVRFEEIKQGKTKKSELDLDFILDIPLTVTVELGRGRMLISELLQLGQSSVIELTKFAGEPMDVFINNRLVAMGEVVVVNEKFGVRLTDIVSPAERLNTLK